MSGPVKFWFLVVGTFVVLLTLLLYLPPWGEQPLSGQHPEDSPVSTAVLEALEVPQDEAPTTLNPIRGAMSTWAGNYRSQMALLLPPMNAIEASPAVHRSVCNDLLTATYNAQNQLEGSPDPDIEESLDRALETFAEAGKFCLQTKAGLRDTYLLLARSGVTLVEKLLEERYSEAGVHGLAEPMEGETEIGRRALEFTKTLKGIEDDP